MLIKLDVEKTLLNSLSLLLLLCSVSNASYTEPLDDWNPAFTYSPTSTGRWNDQTCNICTAQPIRAYLHGETWWVAFFCGDDKTDMIHGICAQARNDEQTF